MLPGINPVEIAKCWSNPYLHSSAKELSSVL